MIDQGENYHFVDVAFHEGGLNYGDKNETIARVLKKFIRTYFIKLMFFGDIDNSEIYFVSPKISTDQVINPLHDNLMLLQTLFIRNGFSPKFSIIANQDFNQMVLSPVLQMVNDVADTNELFLRSMQLLNMFINVPNIPLRNGIPVQPTPVHNPIGRQHIQAHVEDGLLPIGQYVQKQMRFIVDHNLLSIDEVNHLLNPDYSNNTFNLHLPFLRREVEGRKDGNGYLRYYSVRWHINGENYFLNNQWYSRQRPAFQIWLNTIIGQ